MYGYALGPEIIAAVEAPEDGNCEERLDSDGNTESLRESPT